MSQAVWIQGHCFLPSITPAQIEALNARFTPLILTDDGYMRIAETHPTKAAFTHSAPVGRPVQFQPVKSVQTNHRCGYIAFFKPSIAEVLAQVPDDLPPECNAYVIHTEDLVECYSEGDGHRATTVFGVI